MLKNLLNKEVSLTALVFLITLIFFDLLSFIFLICLFILSYINFARDNKKEDKNLFMKHGISKDNNSRMGGIIIFFFICYIVFQSNKEFITFYFENNFLYFILIFITFGG